MEANKFFFINKAPIEYTNINMYIKLSLKAMNQKMIYFLW